jgi:dihydroneopterin aldolase
MGIIKVNGINCYGYHGCLPEEGLVGGQYIVNIELEGDFSRSEETDDLNDTADYVVVFNIVKSEMAIRNKLIEHVARRIKNKINAKYPETLVKVEIIKLKPPMNGDVDSVSYII